MFARFEKTIDKQYLLNKISYNRGLLEELWLEIPFPSDLDVIIRIKKAVLDYIKELKR